jgi:protein ImuB
MTAVSLALKAVEPRRVQNDIFLPPTPEPDKLELTLTRIRALVGEHNVGVPELLDTHRPRPFRLAAQSLAPALRKFRTPNSELRTVLRFFRPAVAAAVRCDGMGPVRIDALDIHGSIVTAAGPWRTSGDWWTTAPWDRDEWDVALSNEKLYRIYCEPSRQWFVEALYD